MTRAAAQQLILQVHAIWSSGDVARLPEVVAETFCAHWPAGWGLPDLYSRNDLATFILDLRTAFPDWSETVQDMIVDDDKVVTRFTATATHLGPYAGQPATGRKISVAEIAIFRIANGKVVELWCLADDLALHHQLQLAL